MTPDGLRVSERAEFGDERIKQVEQEWSDLYARLRELREAGVDPGDPGS